MGSLLSAPAAPSAPPPSARPSVGEKIPEQRPFVFHHPETHRPVAAVCLGTKVGSTMWKALLLRAHHVPGFPGRSPHGVRFTNCTDCVTRYVPGATAQLPPSAPRYMLVRRPHARLLSAYMDKVLLQPDGKVKLPRGFPTNGTFAAFVRAVVRDPNLNAHFQLQGQSCGLREGFEPEYLHVEQSAHPAADPPPPPRAPVPLPTCALPTRAVHQFDYVTAHLNGCTA